MKISESTIEDYHDVVEMFHSESDRGAAILACSYLENYLGLFLKSKLVNDEIVEELFNRFGPLSSFSQRIGCAYAFGFIPKEIYLELHKIKKIRNHFSHHPNKASFDSPPVSQFSENLILPPKKPVKFGETREYTNKLRYLVSVSFVVTYAHNAMHQENR